MHGTRDAASKSESVIGKTTSKSWGCQLDSAQRNCFVMMGTGFQFEWTDPIPASSI